MPRRKIYVARHGKAEHNPKDVFNCSNDPIAHLIELGQQQALALCNTVVAQKLVPTHIYVSPLVRCQETAAPTEERFPDAEVIIDERLVDHQSGYHGLSTKKIVVPFVLSGLSINRCFGEDGESFNDVISRIANFVTDLQNCPPDSTIIVVGHKITLQALYHLQALRWSHHIRAGIAFGGLRNLTKRELHALLTPFDLSLLLEGADNYAKAKRSAREQRFVPYSRRVHQRPQ